MQVTQDRKLLIAVGRSRKAALWQNKEILWSELLDKLATTTRTRESTKEYASLSKAERDEIKDIGGFVGGYLKNGKRNNASVANRCIVCLDWEKMAEYYKISSVHAGQYAFDLAAKGFMRWEEWLPDGLHPDFAGSRVYAECVEQMILQAISQPAPEMVLPAPISSKCWEHAYELPLDDIRRYGAWRKVHVYRIPTAVYELYSASMKSWLSFDMIGRGVVLRLMVNDKTAAYRWRVDGGEWIEKNDPLPPGGKNATEWIREDLLTDELSDDKHVVDIRPIFAKDGVGTNFEVFTVGVIR